MSVKSKEAPAGKQNARSEKLLLHCNMTIIMYWLVQDNSIRCCGIYTGRNNAMGNCPQKPVGTHTNQGIADPQHENVDLAIERSTYCVNLEYNLERVHWVCSD